MQRYFDEELKSILKETYVAKKKTDRSCLFGAATLLGSAIAGFSLYEGLFKNFINENYFFTYLGISSLLTFSNCLYNNFPCFGKSHYDSIKFDVASNILNERGKQVKLKRKGLISRRSLEFIEA